MRNLDGDPECGPCRENEVRAVDNDLGLAMDLPQQDVLVFLALLLDRGSGTTAVSGQVGATGIVTVGIGMIRQLSLT